MRRLAKRCLAGAMSLVLSAGLLAGVPGSMSVVHAEAFGGLTVEGGKSGEDYSYANNILTIKKATPLTIKGRDNNIAIYVDAGVDADITLNGVVIDRLSDISDDSEMAFALVIADNSTGNVSIHLQGANELTGCYTAGVQKNGTAGTLTIDGTGTLLAVGTGSAAGIGSKDGASTGGITIKSGTVTGTSIGNGAGIGSGSNGNVDGITISGGTVRASSQGNGAGIGSGANGSAKNIRITNGTVQPRTRGTYTTYIKFEEADNLGEGYGALLGGGAGGVAENIQIDGGTLSLYYTNASNDPSGAAVGGGAGADGKDIHITGGTINVIATSTLCYGGAGIGGGYNGNGENIVISGGSPYLKSRGGAAIGGGMHGKAVNLQITGGNITAAAQDPSITNCYGGAGIGGGGNTAGVRLGDTAGERSTNISDVTITGGTIKATGATGAAGIGECYQYKGRVYIGGGSVNAIAGAASGGAAPDAVGSGAGGAKAEVYSTDKITEVSLKEFTGYTANKEVKPSLYYISAPAGASYAAGDTYEYGIKDITADTKGKIYLYIPDNVELMEPGKCKGSFNLTVRKDGSAWAADRTVVLKSTKLSPQITYTGTTTDKKTYLFDGVNGNKIFDQDIYHVYVGGTDTGVEIDIDGTFSEQYLDYYSVTAGTVANGTIQADDTAFAGADYTFTVTPADKYVASVKYKIGSGSLKPLSGTGGTFTIPGAEIKGAITIEVTMTENLGTPVDLTGVSWDYSGPYSYKNAPYEIKLSTIPKGIETVTYKENKKTDIGTYTAEASLTAQDGYYLKETTLTQEWEIQEYTPAITLKYNGGAAQEWYTTDSVKVTADGFLIAEEPNGAFSSTGVVFNSTGTKKLYFKNVSTGYVTTTPKEVSVKISNAKPTGKISIDGKSYTTLDTSTAVQRYHLKNNSISFEAEDQGNTGSITVSYLISDKRYTTVAELDAVTTGWQTGKSDVLSQDNRNQTIYAKIADGAGNVTYISTPILYNDTLAPTVSNLKLSEAATDSMKVSFSLGEDCAYAYVVLPSTAPAPQDYAAVKKAIAGGNGAAESGKLGAITGNVTGLAAGTEYKLYVAVSDGQKSLSGEDNANEKVYTSAAVSTQKETIVIETPPSLTGSYGTSVKKMTFSGGLVKQGSKTLTGGTWKVTDSLKGKAEYPEPGTTTAYTVAYTTSAGDVVTCEVTPTVTQIPLGDALSIADIEEQVYDGNEKRPVLKISQRLSNIELSEADYDIAYQNNTNVSTDSVKAKAVITPKAGNKKYTGSVTKEFEIVKGTFTIQSQTVKLKAGTTSFEYDLFKLITYSVSEPEKLGEVTYQCTKGAGSIISGELTINGSKVTIPISTSASGTQELDVSIESDNYQTMTAKLVIEIVNKDTATLSEDSQELFNLLNRTYGDEEPDLSDVKWVDSKGPISADTVIKYENAGGDTLSEAPVNAGKYVAVVSMKETTEYIGNEQRFSFEIKKADYLLGETVKWSDSTSKVYNWETQSITLEGTLPQGLAAEYSGNEEKNCGTYTASVTFRFTSDTLNNNYNLPTMGNCTWKITPYVYEANVVFGGAKSVAYDGLEHEVTVTGIPEETGLKVTKTGTWKAKNAGSYSCGIEFEAEDAINCKAPEDRTYEWEITKAVCNTENLKWYYKNGEGDAQECDANPMTFQENGQDYEVFIDGVPDGASVTYDGTTKAADKDQYVTVAHFNVDGNHSAIEDMMLRWEIIGEEDPDPNPELDMEALKWYYTNASMEAEYIEMEYVPGETVLKENGMPYSLMLKGLPDGVLPEYSGTSEAIEAGDYSVQATIMYLGREYTKELLWTIVKDESQENPEPGPGDIPGTVEIPAVGSTQEYNGGNYRVVSVSETGGTVEYTGPVDKSAASVTIPAEIIIGNVSYPVESIAASAFKNNKSLKTVTIGNGVKTIGANAFNGCKNLKTVKMGSGVLKIGSSAFSGCTKLKTLTIGANVTSIAAKAFYNCKALTSVTIPKKVTSIGKQAFAKCSKLKTIKIKTTKLKKAKVGSKAFSGIKATATITVPKKKLAEYKKILRAKGVGKKAKFKKG